MRVQHRVSPYLNGRAAAWLGALSVLGLMSYPLPFAWLGLAAALGLAARRWWLRGSPLAGSAYTLPLALYGLGALVGLPISLDPAAAGVRFFGLLAATATLYLAIDLVDSPEALRRALWRMLIGVLLVAPVMLLLIAPVEPDRLLGTLLGARQGVMETLDALRGAILRLDPELAGQRFRLSSAGLGMLASIGIGLTLGPILAPRQRRERVIAIAAFTALLLILALASNRTSMLGVGLMLLLIGATRWRWLGILILVPFVVGVAFLAGHAPLRASIKTLASIVPLPGWAGSLRSLEERLEIWGAVLYVMGDFAFTGVGLGIGTASPVYASYLLPFGGSLAHSHNILVESYFEQGILGLAGIAGLIGVTLILSWRSLTCPGSTGNRAMALSASGAGLAILLGGQTQIVQLTSIGMVLTFGAFGFITVVARPLPRATNYQRSLRSRLRRMKGSPIARIAVTGCLLGIVLVITRGLTTPPLAPGAPLAALAASAELNRGALALTQAEFEANSTSERLAWLESAGESLQRAVSLDPLNPRIRLARAEHALRMGDLALVRGELGVAATYAAIGDDETWFQIGRLYCAAADPEQTLAAWARVDPSSSRLRGTRIAAQLIVWGWELSREGRWDEAILVNRAAIQAAPIEPSSYQALALALHHQGGEAAVLHTMLELTLAYPDVPWAFEEVLHVHQRTRRYAEAERWGMSVSAVWRSDAWAARQQREQDTALRRIALPPLSPLGPE